MLSLYISLGGIDLLAMPNLPIHKYSISIYLGLWFLLSELYSFVTRDQSMIVRFCLYAFGAIVSGIIFNFIAHVYITSLQKYC